MNDISFEEFKKLCKDLLDSAPSMSPAETSHALTMLRYSYHDVVDSTINMQQAELALQITLSRFNS